MTDVDIETTRRDLDLWTTRLESTVAELYKELERLKSNGECDGSD